MSDPLNQAVREFLYHRRCEHDADRSSLLPLTPARTADWPNEVWPEEDTNWAEVFGL